MNRFVCVIACVLILTLTTSVWAQPPGRPGGGSIDPMAAVERMMTLDANQDGKLSVDEVTDSRLQALFKRADANQDGVVTAEELKTLFEKEAAADRKAGPGSGGPGGPGRGEPPPGGRGGPPPGERGGPDR